MALQFFTARSEKTLAVLPFLDLTLVWNRGVSYGFLADGGSSTPFFLIAFSIMIVLFLLWLLRTEAYPPLRFAYALIIAGAIGNIVDRSIYLAVIDFISLHAFGYYWYVFNIADIWITIGGVIIFFYGIWRPSEEKPDDYS